MMLLATSSSEPGHLPILLVLGGALFFGTAGARLFRRIRFPQVLGYIVIGLAVGRTWLGLVDEPMLRNFEPFNAFALGLIGFMIGGELHRDVFKRFGRQLAVILLAEGLAACIVVGGLVGGVTYLITGDVRLSLVLGLLLGSIGAATAPAATVRVLQESKAKGPLTTTVFAVVALDDALALAMFAIASSIAIRILPAATGAATDGGLLSALGHTARDLLGSAALGTAAGLLLNWLLRRKRDQERALTYIVGTVTLVIGLGRWLGLDTIVAAMALGVVLTNLAPRRTGSAFEIVERFAPPIYVLFFVLVGAHLYFADMEWWLGILVAVYIVALVIGKVSGSYLGARWTGASATVRKYLGLCMLCQAGVAVGLALRAAELFGDQGAGAVVGTIVITVITGAIFILELVGPPCVKYAVSKAGEAGLNVTEEDLMASYTVADMVDRSAPTFPQGAPLTMILRTIADTDAMSYPVVDDDKKLVGVIALNDLKQSFSAEGLTAWLVAFDLMKPVPDMVTEQSPLADAVDRMRQQELDCLPVLSEPTDGEEGLFVGLLELRKVTRALSQEILHRQQQADAGSF